MTIAVGRRPEPSSGSTKKATFRIDEAVYAAMKECVEAGAASTQTAFVEDAIRQRLREFHSAAWTVEVATASPLPVAVESAVQGT